MFEALEAKFFSPEHIIVGKECQCKMKVLNFCLGHFGKLI